MDERWRSLPPELHHSIIDQSGRRTMLSWSKTCHIYWDYTQPRVWERLQIGYAPQEDGRAPIQSFESSPPPGPIPRHITIDTRGPNTQLTLNAAAHAAIPIIPIMQRWPNIISITHKGAILNRVFADIIRTKDLQTLELRTGTLCNPPGPEEDLVLLQSPDGIFTWRDLRLHFEGLRDLQWLRRLKISQLIIGEVRGLASAMRDMHHLESLELSAVDWRSPWTLTDDRGNQSSPSSSPILAFIKSVARYYENQSFRDGTLPVSLEKLSLRDTYHVEAEFDLTWRNLELVDITKDCTNLQRLKVYMPLMPLLDLSVKPLNEMIRMQKELGFKPKTNDNLPDPPRDYISAVRARLLNERG